MSKVPTLRDVAEYADVSLGTASRALNNKNNVLPETRSRVLRAASDLGYKLQIRVPSAVTSKLNTIGVIVKRDPRDILEVDQFSYGVLSGIEDECRRLGLNAMFSTVPVDIYSHALDTSPILNEPSVDGLVIVGAVFDDAELCDQLPRKMPIVFVDGAACCKQFDSVLVDNYTSAYDMVSYLISKGHQKIALIGSALQENEHPSIRARRLGYQQALRDHDLYNPAYMVKSSLLKHIARESTRDLLNEYPDVTAIFACIDLIAFEIMEEIKDMGLSVPDDISVVGFDDVASAAKTIPSLTTVHVDRALMGVLAVRRLYDRATSMDGVPVKTVIGTRMMLRDSVKSRALSKKQHI